MPPKAVDEYCRFVYNGANRTQIRKNTLTALVLVNLVNQVVNQYR
jgi:hypothetical protein